MIFKMILWKYLRVSMVAYDGKGSETIGINKENSQTNYIGMIGKNKQERVYTMKDKQGTGRLDALFGKKVEDDD
jgi:hypothetical protein